jgi:hypothetical protein
VSARDATPVRFAVPFVVGSARSGTTLLRLMLDAHPQLAIPPETHFVPDLVRRDRRGELDAARFVDVLEALPRWPDFHVDADALRERVARAGRFDLGEALRAFYALHAERFGKPRWGDKTPPYADCMPDIERLLPEARFVHVIRDGRDVAVSIRDLWFGPSRPRAIGEWWVDTIRRARWGAREVSHYLEVRYEDLVADPEPVLRRICEFVELPFDAAMLHYHERAEDRLGELNAVQHERGPAVSGEDRRRIHQLTKKPPQASRVGRWRTELDARERARFEAVAADLLEELGYGQGDEVGAEARVAPWVDEVERAIAELRAVVPAGARYLLADGDELNLPDRLADRWKVPFTEREGRYFGPPETGVAAVAELERVRGGRVDWVVIAWPAFWWLESYPELARRLECEASLAFESERLRIYDLRGAGAARSATNASA